MNVTRRESLGLFGSGLAATAVSLYDRRSDYLPTEEALDRTRLLQLLGEVPPTRPALAAEGVEHVDLGDVVREKITYAVEPGERVPAFVLLPKKGSGRLPAILCHHQHGGEYKVGKDGPAGLASSADQHYALELARRGYVTMVFDALCFNEGRTPRAGSKVVTTSITRRCTASRKARACRASMFGMRGVRWTTLRLEVDASRLGMIGHSLGGQETLFTTAIDTRIRAAVSSCGFGSLRTLKRDRIDHNAALYVPGLANNGDYGAVLALVAPRPYLVAARTEDPIFPKDGIEETVAVGRRAYAGMGATNRLATFYEAGTHEFSPTMREAAYAWLDQWLTRTK